MTSSGKHGTHSTKMEHFISLEEEKTYKMNFSRKNVIGECEEPIRDLSNTAFVFIEEFLREKMWKIN